MMLRTVVICLILMLIIFCFTPAYAYAYIDPGTGSMVVQAVIALIAAIGVSYGVFKNKVKDFFSRIFKRQRGDDEN